MNDGDGVRIVTAGQIIAMHPQPVRALALRGERILATGDPGELRDRFTDASLVDLGDVTVVPGFNDAHQHPTICAEQLLQLDLSPESVGSRGETLAALATRADSTPAGEWIVASGFDDARSYGGAELTAGDLDQACPNHPVLVTHRTLHAGVINSAALRLAGLSDDSVAPPGGELGRDPAGRLTGVLHDQALYDLAFPAFTRRRTIVPRPTTADAERAFHRFAQRLHAAGITSVGDAMVGPGGWELLQGLDQRSSLPVRVTALLAYEHVHQMRPAFDQVRESGGRLRIGGVKAFADGAVNGGACWLEEPAVGVAGNGSPRMAPEELADVVRDVHESGWRVAVHANGDRAIRVTLEAIAAAQQRHARADVRHRIEHVAVVNAEIVETMRRLGVVAVPFGQYPAAHGDKLRHYYEPARTERMFAHRTLLEAGIPVAGSSDYPCGPYEPLYAMQSCVTRADRNGEPFGESQRITPAQALALYTTGSAYASAEENIKGRLAPGYLADFAVLGDDPLTVPPDRLAEIPVLQTWIGGHPVWSRS
jgi:hypothetical protein